MIFDYIVSVMHEGYFADNDWQWEKIETMVYVQITNIRTIHSIFEFCETNFISNCSMLITAVSTDWFWVFKMFEESFLEILRRNMLFEFVGFLVSLIIVNEKVFFDRVLINSFNFT